MLYFWTAANSNTLRDIINPAMRRLVRENQGINAAEIPFVEFDNPPEPKKGQVVLAMGSKSVKVLQACRILPGNLSILKMREKAWQAQSGGVYMVSNDPYAVQMEPMVRADIQWDVRLAARYLKTGTLAPKVGKYRYVNGYQKVIDWVKREADRTGFPVMATEDLETLGLDPWHPLAYIVTIQFTVKAGTAHVLKCPADNPPNDTILKQIEWMENAPEISLGGANLKYDNIWKKVQWGLEFPSRFKFDTLLGGSLVDENRRNGLNIHAKIYTSMGGYDDCVAPETLLCTDDLRWVPAGSIEPGDGLLAFDENVPGYRQRRKMRRARAVSTKRLVKEGVELRLSNGRSLRCSDDHGFLALPKGWGGPIRWVRAHELSPGDRIQSAIDVEYFEETWKTGYLSALYDGEGYVSRQKMGMTSGVSQRPGLVWNRYCSYMEELGLGGFYARAKNVDGVMTSKHSGAATLRLLQKVRPVRLLEKYAYEGKCVPSGVAKVMVDSIVPIGPIEVVSLETSTHTFVAEGLCSHNSFNASHDKARMDLALAYDPERFLIYSGGDTDSCFQARSQIVEEIRSDPGLTDFYTIILHPSARVFEKIEYEGIAVDAEKLRAVGDICDEEAEKAHSELFQLTPKHLLRKLSGKTQDRLKFTPKVLQEIFFGDRGWKLKPVVFTAKDKKPSTSVDGHLKKFSTHPDAGPFLKALKRKNKAEKIKSSYIDGFLKHLRSDGRFHPTFSLHVGAIYESNKKDDGGGTVTGRTAAKNPHCQTLPKRWKPGDYNWPDALRACYPAPPGHLIGEIDYSQGELKIHAMLAREPTMLRLFREGKDMHLLTGCRSEGITYEEGLALEEANPKLYKRIRYGAKAQNFGLIYLQSPLGFQNYAYREWDLEYTFEQCKGIHETFFKLYTKLKRYAMARQTEARDEGCVRNPFGRVRHLPLATSKNRKSQAEALRQAVNSPTQSTLSDMGLWAMAIADKEGLIDEGLRIFNFVHDAVQFYFPDTSRGFDMVSRMGWIMENLPFHEICDWEPELKMTVDAEVGPVLNKLKGIKLSHQLPSPAH